MPLKHSHPVWATIFNIFAPGLYAVRQFLVNGQNYISDNVVESIFIMHFDGSLRFMRQIG